MPLLAIGIGSLAAVIAGILATRLLSNMHTLGRYVPQSDLTLEYLQAVVWASVLGGTILVLPLKRDFKAALFLAWAIRCAVTLGISLFLEYNFDIADAYTYYLAPKEAGFYWSGISLNAGTENIMHLVWLHDRVLPESFHLLKVSFSFIGLLAIAVFYRAAVVLLGRDDKRVFVVLALMPSILYWSSIIGKDPVSLLGIAFYVYGTVSWYKTGRLRHIAPLAFGIIIATLVRPWFGPLMAIPLLAVLLGKQRNGFASGPIVRVLIIVLFLAGSFVAWQTSRFSESFSSTESLLSTTSSVNLAYASYGDSTTEAVQYRSLSQLILTLPLGIPSALFRPLPGEVPNALGFISGIENLVLVIIALVGFSRIPRAQVKHPLFIWAVLFVGIWAAQYGLTAIGSLGSLVRYRLQILPLFLGILLYLLYSPSLSRTSKPRAERARRVHRQ